MDYKLWHNCLFYSTNHIDMQQGSLTALTDTTEMIADTNAQVKSLL